MRSAIAFYISSHGYGHAGRQQALIRSLADAGLTVHVRSAAPHKFFDGPGIIHHSQAYDVGVIQPSALRVDPVATHRAYTALMTERDAIIQAELAYIRQQNIGLIVGDMPPIAFAIAYAAGLPSVAITHFTWDWVYSAYIAHEPAFADIVAQIRADYGLASVALRLPFAHEFDMFPHVEDMPLLVNPITRQRPQLEAELDIPPGQRIALLSMGGHSWDGGDLSALRQQDSWTFLVMPDLFARMADWPQIRCIPDNFPAFHDLIAAADVVIGKAGGSTVSECLAHQTPMLYTLRDDFRENVLLDEALQRYLHSQRLDQQQLLQGDWISQLDAFVERPFAWPDMPADGVQRIHQRVLQALATS